MSASLLNELAVRITEDRETLTARLKMMIGFVDRIDSLFAGVALLNSNEATTVMGKDDLRTRIRNERRAELPIEGVTFFDELRWKT